jgi:hypothetical protein
MLRSVAKRINIFAKHTGKIHIFTSITTPLKRRSTSWFCSTKTESDQVKRVDIQYKNEYNGDVKLIRESIPRHDYSAWEKKSARIQRITSVFGFLFLAGLIFIWITVEPEDEHWLDKMMREKAEKDEEYKKRIEEIEHKNKS